jgi:hypothetical protein
MPEIALRGSWRRMNISLVVVDFSVKVICHKKTIFISRAVENRK